jgi:outer membrane receptor protein involved in Fe transport
MSTVTRLFAGSIGLPVVLASAVIGGSLHSSTVFAQDSAEDENVLEEVYVSAAKRDQRLVDVPMAVTALDGGNLVDRNLLQIEEFASQVPGLHVEQFGNRATRIILRGLNSGGAGATVATLIDETALSYSVATTNGAIDIANLGTYDLNRIEVLRGPQGTIYGAAAEGGVIKYVTNAPDLDRFGGDGEIGVESIEQGDTGFVGQGWLNMPFADGKAAVRITGYYKDVPGYIDNPLNNDDNANDGERYGGRIQLLVEPTDNFSIRLMAMMQDQTFGAGGNVELVGAALTPGTRDPNEFNIAHDGDLQWNTFEPGISDNELRVYSAVLEWNLSSVDIISATSYGEVNSTFRYDISFAELAPGVPITAAFSPFFGVPVASFYSDQTNDLAKFNQEVRISSKETIEAGSIGIDWLVGGFYSDEDITFNQFFDALDPNSGEILFTEIFGFPLPLGGSFLPSTYEEISGFGEIVLHFSDQFDLALGGRYSSNEQWSQVTNSAGLINAPFDIVNDAIETDESKFTWSIAPSYHLTDDTLLYARVATGYRPGGPALVIPGAPPDFPLSYGSDSTVNYEIGTKGSTEDGRFSYDVAAFYIDWTDIQILTQFVSESSGQTFTITGNGGTARSKGLEWNLAWQIADGLVLSDNGSYVDAKLTETAASLGGLKGDQLPMVPEWSNTLNLDYTREMGSALVSMGVTWRYTGERYTGFGAPADPSLDRAPGSHVKLPSSNTFSAQIIANFERFRVRAYVQNLTDERQLTGYLVGSAFNTTGTGQIIQPRTIGIMVGASF